VALLCLFLVACAGSPTGSGPTPSPTAVPSTPAPTRTSQPTSTLTAAPTEQPAPAPWAQVPTTTLPAALVQALTTNPNEGGHVFRVGAQFVVADRGQLWASTDGLSWAMLGELPGADGDVVNDITTGGPGYVAVGWDGTAGAGAVWTSPDGATWTAITDASVFNGNGLGHDINAVTDGPHGLVAVGGVGGPLFATGPFILASAQAAGQAAVWTSPDGRTWHKVPDEASFAQGEMDDVAAGGPGYVAVSRGAECGGPCPGTAGPLVWTSVDGRTWHLVDARHAIHPSGPASATVVAAEPGSLVVAASSGPARAWWSRDAGVHWTGSPIGPDVTDVEGLTNVGGKGFLAVASGIWGSADGRTWVSLSSIPPDDSVVTLGSVACTADRCVAAGWENAAGTSGGIATGTYEIWIGPARVGS